MVNNSDNKSRQILRPGIGGERGGFTVPDGYFSDFARRMAESLPERPELEQPAPVDRSFWAKVRPYVYMAAMFAGIWLMMQLFSIISNKGQLVPMDSNPVLAEALNNDTFVYDYIVSDIDQWSLEDEMLDEGTLDIDDSEEFFNAFSSDEAVASDSAQIFPE